MAEDTEQEQPVPSAHLREIKLTDGVRQRLQNIMQQQAMLEGRKLEILTVALESMGNAGNFTLKAYDPNTGLVTLEVTPTVQLVPPPNRAARRRTAL